MKQATALFLILFLAAGCGRDKQTDADAGDGGFELEEKVDSGTDLEPDAGAQTPDEGGTSSDPDMTSWSPEEREDLRWVIVDQEAEVDGGLSQDITFEVPQGAVSVVVNVAGNPGELYTLAKWQNGDGEFVVRDGWVDADQGAPSLCLSCDNRVASSAATFATILPNNESVTLVPGPHTISVYGFTQSGFRVSPLTGGRPKVSIVAKMADADPTSGTLDVNFHFTGAGGFTAASAQDDPEFQAAIEGLRGLYEQVGIEIGVVTYTDVSDEFLVIESVDSPTSDIHQLFALSADQPRNALNVFFVEELISSFGAGFGTILGISGGVPGPSTAGTFRSGVAISLKTPDNIDVPMFQVLGHEMGHHLGLFHTSEIDFGFGPRIHDPIEDTAEDDESLLMFNSGAGTVLTTEQGRIMRLNPWVRHDGGE